MNSILKKIAAHEYGIAFIEGILAVVLLLGVLSGFWAIHSMEDMRRNIASSAYNVFNSPSFIPFTTNVQGDTVPWGDPTATGLDPIPALRQDLLNDLQLGSSLFSMATNTDCNVAIGYLNIKVPESPSSPPPTEWGRCCDNSSGSTYSIHPSTIMGSSNQLDIKIQLEASEYYTTMTQLLVNTRETLIQMDADTTTQFGATSNTPPDFIYFQWAPFFIWACEGNISAMFGLVPFNAFNWSGVFVPKR